MRSDELSPFRFLNWEHDISTICQRISENPTAIKVILKTRNEGDLLFDWIEHHANIFGSKSLIIFDNMSDNYETFQVYEKFHESVDVFQFEGMHNLLHDANVFGSLYDSIRKACKYYIFLDTDEFLYWVGADGSVISDSTIVDKINNSREKVIPGLWVENALGKRDEILLTFKENRIFSGIKGGKPMVATSVVVRGFGNHNIQLDSTLFEDCKTANLLVVHLKNLSPAQRVKVNLQKLQSYNEKTRELEKLGLLGRNFSVEDLISVNENLLEPGNSMTYIREIKSIVLSLDGDFNSIPKHSSAKINNGYIVFSDQEDEVKFKLFLEEPMDLFRSVFK